MRSALLVLGIVGSFFSGFSNDVITVTLISSDDSGKPRFTDWTVRDAAQGADLIDGEALFIGDEPALIFKACPEECSYKIILLNDMVHEGSQFEMFVAKNGVILPQLNSHFYQTHELHFSFDPTCFSRIDEERGTGKFTEISTDILNLPLERYGKGIFVDVIAADGRVIQTVEAQEPSLRLNSRMWPAGDNMIVCRTVNYNSVVAVIKK